MAERERSQVPAYVFLTFDRFERERASGTILINAPLHARARPHISEV